MAQTEFEFSPLSEARAAAEEAKPVGVDDEVYDDLVSALEKHLGQVSPDMVRARVRIEAYADAQVCQQVLRVHVWPAPIEEESE